MELDVRPKIAVSVAMSDFVEKPLRRFAIVTTYAFPSAKATANRVEFYARCCVGAKADEIFIISSGKDSTAGESDSKEISLNFKVISLVEKDYNRANLLQRAFIEIGHVWRIVNQLRLLRPDFIIFTVPAVPLLLLGMILPIRCFFVDIRDTVWDYLARGGIMNRFAAWCTVKVLKIAARRAAVVAVTNQFEALSVCKQTGVMPLVVQNGISKKKLEYLLKESWNPPPTRRNTVTFTGNVGLAQGLELIIEAVSKSNSFDLRIVGDGAARARLEEFTSKFSSANVEFTGNLDWNGVVEEYSNADILYTQIRNEFASAVPTKIFEYLAIGKPVVLGLPEGPARQIFSKFSGVFIHDPGDLKGLCLALRAAMLPSDIDRLGNIRMILDEHVRELGIKTVVTALNRVCRNASEQTGKYK